MSMGVIFSKVIFQAGNLFMLKHFVPALNLSLSFILHQAAGFFFSSKYQKCPPKILKKKKTKFLNFKRLPSTLLDVVIVTLAT